MLQTLVRPIWFGVFVAALMYLDEGRFTPFLTYAPGLIEGTWVTVQVAVGGCILAVLVGLVAAIAKLYGPLPVRWFAITYIEVFRGTSALVQLFWIFFVLPHFGVDIAPVEAGILALGLNVGAYGAEVIRGAILSVPRGQWEASVALNMPRAAALRRIILPQAFVAMIPPWGNLFIELLKNTALTSLITLTDLTFRARQLNDLTFDTFNIFNLVLLFYLALSSAITLGMAATERRAARGLGRGRVS